MSSDAAYDFAGEAFWTEAVESVLWAQLAFSPFHGRPDFLGMGGASECLVLARRRCRGCMGTCSKAAHDRRVSGLTTNNMRQAPGAVKH